MHIHILGICGTFMGGVALLARAAGHTVTGCDANVYPPMSTQLEEQGIRLIEGYDPRNSTLRPTCSSSAMPCRVATPCSRRSSIAACLMFRDRSGWPSTCWPGAGCWRWRARTARPRRPRCWRGCWRMPG